MPNRPVFEPGICTRQGEQKGEGHSPRGAIFGVLLTQHSLWAAHTKAATPGKWQHEQQDARSQRATQHGPYEKHAVMG